MTYEDVAEEHSRRLDRLIDRGGVKRLKKLYDQAQADLEKKLAREIGRSSAPFTIHQYRVLLAQVRRGQMQIAGRLGDEAGRVTVETQTDVLHGLVSQIKKLEAETDAPATTLPIEDISRFLGVIDKDKTSLLVQNAKSMAGYGASVVKRIEGNLALTLATGGSAGDAIETVASTADIEWWRAERIVRTEQSWAAHSVIAEGIKASADALGDLYMRWTELVSDSGKPLDDRVGADSVAMHGQVAQPGRMFTMPYSATSIEITNRYGKSRVSHEMLGKSWAHPPNRPNDRSTVVPWRPQWGSVGWHLVGGEKVTVRAPRRR